MSAVTRHASICRFCGSGCPVVVEVEDGRATKVSGNKASPTYDGFCCTRGQAVPEQLYGPDRLITSMKKGPDGRHAPIASEAAMDEIAEKITALVDTYGANSIAGYFGSYTSLYPASAPFMAAFLRALGTSMLFTPNTIDQPGKDIAAALLGGWEAGPHVFAESDVWMILGGNALVSIGVTIPGQNPGKRLSDALARGMKLIVIDPRRTETARRAHIHLQPRPGEDATILAGMIRLILAENLHDADFAAENVGGLEALRAAVEPFTPSYVAARADIDEADFVAAARMFAAGPRGTAVGATGVNMSGRSSLTEYLILALNSICGRFLRAGERLGNPGVLLPRAVPKAQPKPARPALDPSRAMSVRGLVMGAAGWATAALADEILAGRIRALISVGGNPVAAFPDQPRTIAALSKLDLFVQVDPAMSASAKLAHYVVAPLIEFETPTATYQKECLEFYSVQGGSAEPFGLYAPAITSPPRGSDLIEDWELFYGLARRLGLELRLIFASRSAGAARERRRSVEIDMAAKPTSDEVLELLTRDSRVPLSEVKRHPNGALFPEDVYVAAKDPDCQALLNVGEEGMMRELGEVSRDHAVALREGAAFPFLMISRRLPHVFNSTGQRLPRLIRKGGRFNPAFMHPKDMQALGLADGQEVQIESRHGALPAIVEADETLRQGVVSMAHAFGDLPSETSDVRQDGCNTGALISVEDDFDRYSGIPRMSALPVRVNRVTART